MRQTHTVSNIRDPLKAIRQNFASNRAAETLVPVNGAQKSLSFETKYIYFLMAISYRGTIECKTVISDLSTMIIALSFPYGMY